MRKYLLTAALMLAGFSPAIAQDSASGGRLDAMQFMAQFYDNEEQTRLRTGDDFATAVRQLEQADRDILREECKNVNSMRASFCESFMSIAN